MSTVKCSCCGKKLRRSPSKVYAKNYCDTACRLDEKIRWIGFVIANRFTMKSGEIADYIGLTHSGFRTWINIFNKHLKGYARISFYKPATPKKIRVERLNAAKVQKQPPCPATLKTKAEKPKKASVAHKTEKRRETAANRSGSTNGNDWALFPLSGTRNIRIVENERLGKVAVKIDSRTTIFVYPHEVDRIINKYKKAI